MKVRARDRCSSVTIQSRLQLALEQTVGSARRCCCRIELLTVFESCFVRVVADELCGDNLLDDRHDHQKNEHCQRTAWMSTKFVRSRSLTVSVLHDWSDISLSKEYLLVECAVDGDDGHIYSVRDVLDCCFHVRSSIEQAICRWDDRRIYSISIILSHFRTDERRTPTDLSARDEGVPLCVILAEIFIVIFT